MMLLPALLPALRDLVLAQLPHYGERCIANTLHSAAALDMRDRELLARLMDAAAQRAAEMTPQGVANVAWALARLRAPPPPRLQAALLSASSAAMGAFSPQELADVGWAVVLLRLAPAPEWAAAWLAASQSRLPHANDVAAARLLWTAARLGVTPGEEWRERAWRAVEQRLPAASPHSVAMTLWAAQQLWGPAGGLDTEQRGALLQRVVDTLPAAHAADVTVVLHALAGPGGAPPNEAAAAALLSRAARLVPAMTMAQVTKLLWACARLRLAPGEGLLRRCASKLFYGLADVRAGDLAIGLWGLARLGWVPPAGWAGLLFSQVGCTEPWPRPVLCRLFPGRLVIDFFQALALCSAAVCLT
jgi:hypothetical protein